MDEKEEWVLRCIGYLQGTLKKEEKTLFLDWIDEIKENKRLYFELKTVYDQCMASGRDYQVDKSWKKLLIKRKKENKNIRKIAFSVFRYAALVLFSVAGTLLYHYYTREQPGTINYQSGNGVVADIIRLPDGTEVSLSTETQFEYGTDFGQKHRNVFLKGEAYFDVARDEKHPFIVKTQYQEMEVLGTKFNVMAYGNDSIVMTTLLDGSLKVKVNGSSVEPVVLSPNQQLVYNKNQNKLVLANVKALDYTKWIEGYYYFSGQDLESILHRLGNLYGVEFIIESGELKKKEFKGTFYRGQSIKEILEIVNLSTPIKYRIEQRKVYILK